MIYSECSPLKGPKRRVTEPLTPTSSAALQASQCATASVRKAISSSREDPRSDRWKDVRWLRANCQPEFWPCQNDSNGGMYRAQVKISWGNARRTCPATLRQHVHHLLWALPGGTRGVAVSGHFTSRRRSLA